MLPPKVTFSMGWPGQLPDRMRVLDSKIEACRACPRLVEWREEVAKTKRRAYENEKYWGRPVSGFGAKAPALLVVGLAPGAHGANRTGRIFTGDSSGDWLYRSLHGAGLAKLPTSIARNDGQALIGTRITCAVHCAPPGNKPTPGEIAQCGSWLTKEFELLFPTVRAYLALGSVAWRATATALSSIGEELPRRRPKFGHGASFKFRGSDGNTRLVIASYHPSQQNTFTGKLTRSQLDSVIRKAGRFAHASSPL